jgi:quinol monooxygenase YgiN
MVAPASQDQNKNREDFVVIYVVATLTVKPETRAELIAAATACIRETRKEPGNIAYDLHESVTDPSKLVFVEQWENADALVPHRGAEHTKAFGRVAVKCMAAPPKIEVITPEKVEVR